FLHYPSGQTPGGTIAEAHTDHSGFTFHLYETTDGCQRLTLDTRQWQSLPVAEGEAAAFTSMQTQLVSGGEIKALSHRVLANETSSQVGRFAIVCFVALKDIPAYDKRTHGRLQEFTPGFNYDLTPEEFTKLFVKK
ncbi:MAG TPA: 2OG-Fe(II) oxygenase family protein, partial [Candidatus Saccharimonadales bacterium]|nr:2OG-Fe(II) oxygenase family protein [Candidatus Saccharimonadales bacterium]